MRAGRFLRMQDKAELITAFIWCSGWRICGKHAYFLDKKSVSRLMSANVAGDEAAAQFV